MTTSTRLPVPEREPPPLSNLDVVIKPMTVEGVIYMIRRVVQKQTRRDSSRSSTTKPGRSC